MEIEQVSEQEYQKYIALLKSKSIQEMNYSEMTDLASHEIGQACDTQNWEQLKVALRLMILAMNFNSAKADAVKNLLIRMANEEEEA